jgi:hypothetical protein
MSYPSISKNCRVCWDLQLCSWQIFIWDYLEAQIFNLSYQISKSRIYKFSNERKRISKSRIYKFLKRKDQDVDMVYTKVVAFNVTYNLIIGKFLYDIF